MVNEIFNYLMVKKKLKEFGYTYQNLANYLTENNVETSVDVVKSWLRKNDKARSIPNLDKIRLIGHFLKLEANQLFMGFPTDKKVVQNDVKFVPIVGNASCGVPALNSYQEIEKKAYCSATLWNPYLYAIIADGDSMEPEISNGDEVICDPNAEVLNGDIVHYQIENESAIKTYKRIKNIIHLMPLNNEYKTKIIKLNNPNIGIKMSKVIDVHKSKMNDRLLRLKYLERNQK